jgi:spermidine/putrescine ABC transporter ATP-binding subunit
MAIESQQIVSQDEEVVKLEQVRKEFGDIVAVDDVDLSIRDGEILTLLGPSGCGKTTTLRMIAGFETPSSGEIFINGSNVSEIPPYKRDTGMVFQRYALFKHMTVADNIAFGLKMQGVPGGEIDQRVDEILEMVQLPQLKNRYPAELSGGQQQRVALARSLVIEPTVLLLDEPLANLDKKLREEMRLEFLRLHEELDVTMVYVTHNQEEALMISDRMAVMSDGQVHQVGTPEEVYHEPTDEFVADFIGQATFLAGELTTVSKASCDIDLDIGSTITVDPSILVNREQSHERDRVNVLFRPEKFEINTASESAATTNSLRGSVIESTFLGNKMNYFVDVGGETIHVEQQNLQRVSRVGNDTDVDISFENDTPLVLPAKGD